MTLAQLTQIRTGRCMAAAVATAALIALLLAAAPRPAPAQEVNLRMHTHVPPVASSFKNLTWWIEQVAKESAGKVKIQLFGSNQLGGKAEDVYGQAADGVVDIGWTLPGYRAGRFPRASVFELPFMGDKPSIVAPAVWEFYGKWLTQEFGDTHPLVLHVAGNMVLHMKAKEVRSVDDIKNMKIRTPSREVSDAIKLMGGVPVPIPGLGMTEAMMRGVIDGALAPWAIALAIRQIDVATSHTEIAFNQPMLAMIMNKDSYAKLPADAKAAIDKTTGMPLAVEFGKRWQADDEPGLAKAKSLNHPVIALNAAETQIWAKTAEPVIENWIKEMTEKGQPGKALVDDASAMVAKYRGMATH